MRLQDLEILITANTGELKKELSKVTDALEGLQGTTSSVSDAVGSSLTSSIFQAQIATQILTSALKTVGNALFNVFQGLVQNGSELGRIKVATNVVARNMGMTADEVDKLRDSLEEANTFGIQAEEVIKTLALSGLTEMADSVKVLDARTGEYQDGVSGLVLAMKDLSAGALVDSADGIDRITRFIRSGNVSYVDNIIEVGNLTDAYQEYAQQMGKTVGQMSAQEKAFVRMNIVVEEGEKTFGAYASTMQSAGKLFQSIQKKWTQISATIGEALSPIWDTFANGFYQLTSAIFEGVQGATEGIRSFASKVAGYLIVLFRIIGTLLSKLPLIGDRFKDLANFTMKPIKTTKALDKAIDGYANSTDNANKSTKELEKSLAGLAGFDEMNVLKSNEDTGAGGGAGGIGDIGGGIGGASDWGLDTTDWTNEANLLADGVFGEFSKLAERLKAIFGGIKNDFTTMFNSQGVQDLLNSVLATFNTNLPNIFSAFTNLKNLWSLMWFDLTKTGEVYAPLILDSITKLLNSIWTEAFDPAIKLLTTMWSDFTGSLVQIWGEDGESLLDNLGKFVNEIVSLFQSIWDNVIAPIVQPFLEMLQRLWDDTLKGVVEEVVQFVMKLVDTALTIYNNFISPIVKALLTVLKPAFDFIGNVISTAVQLVVSVVGGAIQAVVGWFNGLLDFIKGAFSGNWELMMKGLSDMTSSLFNGIVNIVKGVINSVIDMLNRFTGTINRAIDKIPNEVFSLLGRNKADVKIPTIPRLAEGGIVSSPTLAMIGEAGKEAVVPLDNNDWLKEIATLAGDKGNINLTIKIGEDKIYEKFVDYINDGTMRSNSALLNI